MQQYGLPGLQWAGLGDNTGGIWQVLSVTGPGNETFPSPSLETSQSSHLLGSLALFSILQALLYCQVGLLPPLQLFLYIWSQEGVLELPLGYWNSQTGFLRKSCSLQALRQARQGWER